MHYLKEIRTYVETQRIFKPNLIIGYTDDEIAACEQADDLHYPNAFKEYLQWMGHTRNDLIERTGHQWQGGFEKLDNAALLKEARELLRDNEFSAENLTDDALIFWYYQGYAFWFLRCDEGGNPPIYNYQEGDAAIAQSYPSFSELLYDLATHAVESSRSKWLYSLGDLDTLTTPDDRLECLTLNGTIKFSHVPEKFFDFVNLKELFLSHTGLEELDARIGELQQLEDLWLGMNQLEGLPPEIATLPKLKRLNIAGNYFSAETIAQLHEWLPNCDIQADNQQAPVAPPSSTMSVQQPNKLWWKFWAS